MTGTDVVHPEIAYSLSIKYRLFTAWFGTKGELMPEKIVKCRESLATARRLQRNVTLPETTIQQLKLNFLVNQRVEKF